MYSVSFVWSLKLPPFSSSLTNLAYPWRVFQDDHFLIKVEFVKSSMYSPSYERTEHIYTTYGHAWEYIYITYGMRGNIYISHTACVGIYIYHIRHAWEYIYITYGHAWEYIYITYGHAWEYIYIPHTAMHGNIYIYHIRPCVGIYIYHIRHAWEYIYITYGMRGNIYISHTACVGIRSFLFNSSVRARLTHQLDS